MKKIIASALGLMLGGGLMATTAQAELENQFGGYWRTRIPVQDNFSVKPDGTYHRVDTRTRIYYTAKFSDDIKFVNKFEFNTVWGDTNGGDLGTDGSTWKVKHSYVDFTTGALNFKVGMQAGWYGRGLLFDDDFAGATVIADFGNIKVPVHYLALQNEDGGGQDFDVNAGIAAAIIKAGDAITVTPYVMYADAAADTDADGAAVGDSDSLYLGADIDVKLDAVSIFGTGIYQTGEEMGVDRQAFVLLGGVDAGIAHGQALYASGDDADADNNAYASVSPWYTTSEIVGAGILNNASSAGGPGAAPTNYIALNGGVKVKPMENLTVKGDVWYMMLAEDDAAGNDELGLEFDGVATYKMFDKMNIDIILAYLVAGDATNYATGNDDDVWEAGARLSFKW